MMGVVSLLLSNSPPEQQGSSSGSFYIDDCFPSPSSSSITGLRQIVSEYCMTFWYLNSTTGDTVAMDNWHADPSTLGDFEQVPGRDVIHFRANSTAQTGRIYGTVGNPPVPGPDYNVRVVNNFGVRGAFEYEPADGLSGPNLPMDSCVTTLYFGDEFGGTTFPGLPGINFSIDQETQSNFFGGWNFPFVSVDHTTIVMFSYDFNGIRAVADATASLYTARTVYFPLLAAWVGFNNEVDFESIIPGPFINGLSARGAFKVSHLLHQFATGHNLGLGLSPDVLCIWDQDVPPPSQGGRTHYNTAQSTIYLDGHTSFPSDVGFDEWDDFVIAHEYAHHIQNKKGELPHSKTP